MNDEDECGHEECDGELDAPFTWFDLLIAFFGFLSGVAQAFGNSADYMLKSSVAASNRQSRMASFHEDAAREIETITGGLSE